MLMEPAATNSRNLGEIEVLLNSDDEHPVVTIFTRSDTRYQKVHYYDAEWSRQVEQDVEESDNAESCEAFDRQLENLQIIETAPSDAPHFEEINDNENFESTEYIILDERDAMAAMGLPTEFGDKRKRTNSRRVARIGKEECAKFILPSLKEQYGLQTLESARPVFTKMGYFYSSGVDRRSQTPEPKAQDEVPVKVNESVPEPMELRPETKIVQIHNAQDEGEKEESIFIKPTLEKEISKNIQKDLDAELKNVEKPETETVDESGSEYNSARSHFDEETIGNEANANTKKKNKKKRNKLRNRAAVPEEIQNDKSLLKYYHKRYTLFSLYDEGIQMDREAWFSATPECIATHTANRLRCDVIVDGFCGTGGNAIQFAMTCNKVIAIDIDPHKVEMAKHNANIYGVADRIEFIIGDYLQLAARIKADVVFLSPPWGGPDYKCSTVYDLEANLRPVPASELFATTARITTNIAMYLPKNSDTKQLIKLAGAGNPVELEQNFLFNRVTAVTAYYGDLIRQNKD